MNRDSPAPQIGVFDSGVGGLSVLRAIRARLPGASITYIGDVAHAPYGERTHDEVMARSHRLVGELVSRGARLVVVACNTVTVIGIEILRRDWPGIQFVGVEPGIKPAAAQSRIKRIAVLATPTTATSQRLKSLIDTHADGVHVHIQACPGLAAAIENAAIPRAELRTLLGPPCDAVRRAGVDVVILGCTHYAFITDLLAEQFGPGVTLLDTADAVANRVQSLWRDRLWRDEEYPAAPSVRVFSTGHIETMAKLLASCDGFEAGSVTTLKV